MERTVGSMGSEFTRFRFAPEEIPVLAGLDWSRIARRVFIDPASGVIALMSPSSKHERYAWGAGLTAIAIGERLGIRAIALGATRWRRPEDPEKTGAEPDACFYLGPGAEQWVEARRQGEAVLEAYEDRTPPDLVIEVERSRGDADKPSFHRRLGVREMWRLDIGRRTTEATMLDLLAPSGPLELEMSVVLPHARPGLVLEALELAVDNRRRELDALIASQLSAG